MLAFGKMRTLAVAVSSAPKARPSLVSPRFAIRASHQKTGGGGQHNPRRPETTSTRGCRVLGVFAVLAINGAAIKLAAEMGEAPGDEEEDPAMAGPFFR
ncbi:hypothetical protein SMMN14_02882 [Sphaerulina musiva]